MIFFTKTCARDIERFAYQARAIGRLFPDRRHVALIEWAELLRLDLDRIRLPIRCVFAQVESSPLEVQNAMEIEDPYTRQQYLKLVAPTVWGDMIQLDSDMCPFTSDCPLLGPPTVHPLGSGHVEMPAVPRWFHAKARTKTIRSACSEWRQTYELAFGSWGSNRKFVHRPSPGRHGISFMLEQHGWYLRHDVAAAFIDTLEASMGIPLYKALPLLAKRGKLSEYQLFGMWAYDNRQEAYEWVEGQAPKWVHHFSSTEQLEPSMRSLLVGAAGE